MEDHAARLLRSFEEPLGVIAERFELLAEAGSGGMGTVYRASDRETGGLVALKLMNAEGDTDRFNREAAVLAELRHPAIVSYVAHGKTPDGELYLAMEWLEGETLRQHLATQPLGLGGVLKVGARIAGGLAAAHDRKIVHRDLKPSNIFLANGSPDDAKILDFGVARLRDLDRELTRSGQVIGTPGYMAPEQARGLRDIDGRADLFSLGCVLFRCLTGRPAFGGQDVLAILAELVLSDPPRVAAIVSGVPRDLDALIARLLEKDAARRPASAADVEAELLHVATCIERGDVELASAPKDEDAGHRSVFVVVGGPGASRAAPGEITDARGKITRIGGTLEEIAGGVLIGTVEETGPLSRRRAAELEEIVRRAVHDGPVSRSRALERVEPSELTVIAPPPSRRRFAIIGAIGASVAIGSGAFVFARSTPERETIAAAAGSATTCSDGIQNDGETQIDCGGPACAPCAPSCADETINQDETDIDCGGSSCAPCPVGAACTTASDCATDRCAGDGRCSCVPRDGVVIISEVRSRGPDGGSDEFVELYNAGSTNVTLSSDWVLEWRTETGVKYSAAFTGSGQVVGPGRHVLLAGTGYPADLPRDGVLSPGISDEGSLVLRRGGEVVDAVCFSCGRNGMSDHTCEGDIAEKSGCAHNADRSLERKPGGDAGSCADTDDNGADFADVSPSTPETLASAARPASVD
ncbi:MAG: protein kinase [Polyangiaceae bacterium]|nr:protein kinase [Polyangiaceae bacterium]